MHLRNASGQLIARQVLEARSFFARGKGLLGRSSLDEDSVMWIVPCNNIHTWFMKFPLDVVFVDRELFVKAIFQDLTPFRIVWPVWKAHSVFEFSAGKLKSFPLQLGDRLYVGD